MKVMGIKKYSPVDHGSSALTDFSECVQWCLVGLVPLLHISAKLRDTPIPEEGN